MPEPGLLFPAAGSVVGGGAVEGRDFVSKKKEKKKKKNCLASSSVYANVGPLCVHVCLFLGVRRR